MYFYGYGQHQPHAFVNKLSYNNYLYDVYVNELSELLNKSGIGGNLGGTIINHMLYADDILCIVSLSSTGLQHLLNICSDYYERHDLTFNAKKSMCMYFSTSINKHCGLPVTYLGNCECQFVNANFFFRAA